MRLARAHTAQHWSMALPSVSRRYRQRVSELEELAQLKRERGALAAGAYKPAEGLAPDVAAVEGVPRQRCVGRLHGRAKEAARPHEARRMLQTRHVGCGRF